MQNKNEVCLEKECKRNASFGVWSLDQNDILNILIAKDPKRR